MILFIFKLFLLRSEMFYFWIINSVIRVIDSFDQLLNFVKFQDIS